MKRSEEETGSLTTVVCSVLLNDGKSVLKMMETLWKNSRIIAERVEITHADSTVVATTFAEKQIGGFTSAPHLVGGYRSSEVSEQHTAIIFRADGGS
jgi:hypothetical protein